MFREEEKPWDPISTEKRRLWKTSMAKGDLEANVVNSQDEYFTAKNSEIINNYQTKERRITIKQLRLFDNR